MYSFNVSSNKFGKFIKMFPPQFLKIKTSNLESGKTGLEPETRARNIRAEPEPENLDFEARARARYPSPRIRARARARESEFPSPSPIPEPDF